MMLKKKKDKTHLLVVAYNRLFVSTATSLLEREGTQAGPCNRQAEDLSYVFGAGHLHVILVHVSLPLLCHKDPCSPPTGMRPSRVITLEPWNPSQVLICSCCSSNGGSMTPSSTLGDSGNYFPVRQAHTETADRHLI